MKGESWIGSPRKDARFDEIPSEARRRQLIEATRRFVPAVAKALILAHSVALRSMNSDRFYRA
jgi:hypothetical protein